MIECVLDNWWMVIIALAVIGLVITGISSYAAMNSDERINKIRQWLRYAVLQAERELGSGTGMAKLSMVYDMFVARFPAMARVVTFAEFSALVDESLLWLKNQLNTNEHMKEIVNESK